MSRRMFKTSVNDDETVRGGGKDNELEELEERRFCSFSTGQFPLRHTRALIGCRARHAAIRCFPTALPRRCPDLHRNVVDNDHAQRRMPTPSSSSNRKPSSGASFHPLPRAGRNRTRCSTDSQLATEVTELRKHEHKELCYKGYSLAPPHFRWAGSTVVVVGHIEQWLLGCE